MDLARARKKFFPLKTKSGFLVKPSTRSEVEAFLKKSFAAVFPPRDSALYFVATGKRRARIRSMQRRYATLHHEWFLFLNPAGKPVGWHIGEAEDAVTFYMRNTGILPKFQRHGVYGEFFPVFIDYLGALGYERVTSQHQATNRRILITKLRRGFDVAGLELTENWGPLVKLVKIIPRDRRLCFYRQYGEMTHWE